VGEEVYEKGLGIRREVLGNEYVDRAMQNADAFSADFQRFVTEYCWGDCWGRDALPRTTRSLIVLAILATSGRWEEFELHFRGALRNGCTHEELQDALFHVAVYGGLPAGVSAFRTARRVLAEEQPSA
jgi:4-carboxymuconolactone decarboxylase